MQVIREHTVGSVHLWGAFGVVALALVAGALAPSPARAAVFCAPSPCDNGTAVATIEDAVDQADAQAGPDTVVIEPGTHELPTGPCGGLFVTQIDTSILGHGIGTTILTTPPLPPDFGSTRNVICGHMQLSDVTLRLPSAETPGKNSSAQGIDLYSGSIDRVRIDDVGASFGPDINDGQGDAALIRNGAVRNVEVEMDPAKDVDGIRLSGGIITEISDVTVSTGKSGISGRVTLDTPSDPPTVLRGLRLHAPRPLNLLNNSGKDASVLISDSLLDASGAAPGKQPTALNFGNSFQPNSFSAVVDRVTVVGNGDPDSVAIQAYGRGVPPTTLDASHLAITGFDKTLDSSLQGGDVEVSIDSSVGDFSPAAVTSTDNGGGTATTNLGPGIVNADPMLVNPSAGDFRLQHESAAVDLGGTSLIPEPPTDLNGAPRPVDGDGDGIVATDAGAFEHVNNAVKIRRIKLNKRNGTAKLKLAIPNAGELELAGRGIKGRQATLAGPGRTTLKVTAKGKTKRKLRRKGKVQVRAQLRFVPEGGTRGTQKTKVKLKRKRRR